MKLPLAITFAAIGLPLSSALWQPGTNAASHRESPLSESTAAMTTERDGTVFRGTIVGWLIENDGSVLVNLRDTDGKQEHWFRTPPSQSSTTQFELLALHAVLRLDPDIGAASHTVEIRGDSTSEHNGSTRDRSMRLLSIGHI